MRTGHLATIGMVALAALASVVLHATDAGEAALVAKGRIEGAAGAVWLGVFGDDENEASWTRVKGADFEVELPPGESATILAIARDRVPHVIPLAGDAADSIAVGLAPGLALSGTVRSEDGGTLVAEITARPAEGYGFEVPAFAAPRWRSAPNGEFEIAGLRPGRYAIEVSAEGHVPLALEDVPIKDDESNRLDVELEVAAFVTGRVVDSEGAPAVDVEVLALGDEGIVARTGADGAFRLGPFSVGQSAEILARSAETDATRRRYVHAPYEGLLLEFPRHVLMGQVVDAGTGAPVQRYRVVVLGSHSSQWEHRIDAEDGAFRVPLDAQAHDAVIHAEGYSPSVLDMERCDAECRLGVIQLQQLSIAGRVVDARSGQPIAGATFDLFRWRGPADRRSYYFRQLSEDVSTDMDGAFELGRLPSIPMSFVVAAPGYHRKEIALPPFDSLLAKVDAYEDGAPDANGWPSIVVARLGGARRKIALAPTATDLVVELDFRDAGPTIAGRLTLADGTPVDGTVWLYRTDGTAISFPPRTTPLHEAIRETDERGEFRFEGLGLPDGEYGLQPRSAAGVMDSRAVVVENGQSVENIQLRVKAGRQLRIDIAGLEATVVSGREPFHRRAAVTIEDENGRFLFESSYRNGAHILRGLPEETLFVSAHARPHRLVREVPAGESDLEFDFTRGRSRLAGVVTMEGRPLPDFLVRAVPSDLSGLVVEARTTDSGHYDARGLSQGPHTVVTPTGHAFEVHVAGDTTFDVDLPPISLSGVVRAKETGLPLRGALVRLYRVESWSDELRERAGLDGEFRFNGLAAGEYAIYVTSTRFDDLQRRIHVVGHEVLELELRNKPQTE